VAPRAVRSIPLLRGWMAIPAREAAWRGTVNQDVGSAAIAVAARPRIALAPSLPAIRLATARSTPTSPSSISESSWRAGAPVGSRSRSSPPRGSASAGVVSPGRQQHRRARGPPRRGRGWRADEDSRRVRDTALDVEGVGREAVEHTVGDEVAIVEHGIGVVSPSHGQSHLGVPADEPASGRPDVFAIEVGVGHRLTLRPPRRSSVSAAEPDRASADGSVEQGSAGSQVEIPLRPSTGRRGATLARRRGVAPGGPRCATAGAALVPGRNRGRPPHWWWFFA
jgi:hypothetical protein